MDKKKKKLLVFHQSLAPYRVDLWNRLNKLFDLKIYFIYENLLDQKFDQDRLRGMLDFKPYYLNAGITIGVRAFRWGFRSIIKAFNPDIVFTYEYSQTTISIYFIKKIFGYKYELYSMSDDSLEIIKHTKGIRKILRSFLVKKLDGLVLISNEAANWYRSSFGTNKKWIVLSILANEQIFRHNLKNALPLTNAFINKFELSGKKIVFFIGRLMPVKGIDRVIKAFSLIHEFEKEALLLIIGNGDEYNNLKQLTIEYNVEEKVLFPGRYEGKELMAWYNIGQIFALASHYEPFGAVINEALLAGANVLCSTNAGASTLIKIGENGFLFDPYNVKELSEMLRNELRNAVPINQINIIKPSKMKILFEENIKAIYTQLNF